MTKQDIVELLRNNDKAICRALVVLNERQTADEQVSEDTKHRNGQGFRPCHARMGTSMARFYASAGYLSAKQIAYWRKEQNDGKMRIEIYAGQLLQIANEKATKELNKIMKPKHDVGNLMEELMVLEEIYHTNPDADSEIGVRIDEIKALIKETVDC